MFSMLHEEEAADVESIVFHGIAILLHFHDYDDGVCSIVVVWSSSSTCYSFEEEHLHLLHLDDPMIDSTCQHSQNWMNT